MECDASLLLEIAEDTEKVPRLRIAARGDLVANPIYTARLMEMDARWSLSIVAGSDLKVSRILETKPSSFFYEFASAMDRSPFIV